MNRTNLFVIGRENLLISFTTAALKFCYSKESFVSLTILEIFRGVFKTQPNIFDGT